MNCFINKEMKNFKMGISDFEIQSLFIAIVFLCKTG